MTLGFVFTGRGYKTRHNRTAGMVSAVFTVLLMISGVLRPMMAKIIPVFSGDDYIDKLFVSKSVSPWAEAGIFLMVWILLFGLLIFACETMEKAVPAVYMLLFGLGAKTVMGFSPMVCIWKPDRTVFTDRRDHGNGAGLRSGRRKASRLGPCLWAWNLQFIRYVCDDHADRGVVAGIKMGGDKAKEADG